MARRNRLLTKLGYHTRHRHRQTQTDADRHRQTQTDTDRHRQTQTDTDRHRQTQTDTVRHTHTQTNKHCSIDLGSLWRQNKHECWGSCGCAGIFADELIPGTPVPVSGRRLEIRKNKLNSYVQQGVLTLYVSWHGLNLMALQWMRCFLELKNGPGSSAAARCRHHGKENKFGVIELKSPLLVHGLEAAELKLTPLSPPQIRKCGRAQQSVEGLEVSLIWCLPPDLSVPWSLRPRLRRLAAVVAVPCDFEANG